MFVFPDVTQQDLDEFTKRTKVKTQYYIKWKDCLKDKELILIDKSQRKFRESRRTTAFLLLQHMREPKEGTVIGRA